MSASLDIFTWIKFSEIGDYVVHLWRGLLFSIGRTIFDFRSATPGDYILSVLATVCLVYFVMFVSGVLRKES